MQIARTRIELATCLAHMRAPALVPTMGALHDGHLALVAVARAFEAGAVGPVVASIFVNPLQFDAGADLGRYPRDPAADLALLAEAGCELAFLPAVEDMYPAGHATTVDVAGPALGFEGARRPGHFRGVATVVAGLFGLVRPGTAWFGQKDWQQLQVIRRMVADLGLPVAIHDVPTERAPDGLALSSRNRFLSPTERALAPALARTGLAAAAAVRGGEPIAAATRQGREVLGWLGFEVDYLAVVEPASMLSLDRLEGPARLVIAARLGSVRLLDNFPV